MPAEKLIKFKKSKLSLIKKNLSSDFLLINLIHFQEDISNEVSQIAEESLNILNEAKLKSKYDKKKIIPFIKISYYWLNDVVSFLVLIRDIIFELQKADLMAVDNLVSSNEIKSFHKTSINKIETAFEEVISTLQHESIENKKFSKEEKKILNKFSLKNPWPIFKKQINELFEHSNYILEKFIIINTASNIFKHIQLMLIESVNACMVELEEIKDTVKEIEHFIEEKNISDKENIPEQIIKHLNLIESTISFKYHIDEFNVLLEKDVEKLSSQTEFPININDSSIVTNEINFKARLKHWLNKQILPSLSEIWEIVEVNSNGLKMALRNMTNVLKASTDNTEEKNIQQIISELNDYIQPFLSNIKAGEIFVNKLSETIITRIRNDMKISDIFNEKKYFLISGVEDKIEEPKFIIFKRISKIKHYIKQKSIQISFINTKIHNEKFLGNKEKIVRYIKERHINENNSHYDNFFITKGYYGDTFLIERKRENKQLVQVYENWLSGYRSSVLITGKRSSGKTMFGESFAYDFFPLHTIRLVPGTKFEKDGKSIELNYNLNKSLKFVANNYKNEKKLIWIDNLELWWDNEYPLGTNIKSLCSFIDQYSDRFFIIASINSATKSYITELMPFDKTFQAIINLSQITKKDAEKAIRIRHAATQRKMLDKRGTHEASKSEMKSYIKKAFKESKGIIGHTLYLWTLYTNNAGEKHVFFKNIKFHKLPDFINDENGIVLSYIYLQKKTTEIRLRKMFGPAYNRKYDNIVKRFLGLGILIRNVDGWIEINEQILGDIGKLLSKKNYIKY